jgi:hypothetical protein
MEENKRDERQHQFVSNYGIYDSYLIIEGVPTFFSEGPAY